MDCGYDFSSQFRGSADLSNVSAGADGIGLLINGELFAFASGAPGLSYEDLVLCPDCGIDVGLSMEMFLNGRTPPVPSYLEDAVGHDALNAYYQCGTVYNGICMRCKKRYIRHNTLYGGRGGLVYSRIR